MSRHVYYNITLCSFVWVTRQVSILIDMLMAYIICLTSPILTTCIRFLSGMDSENQYWFVIVNSSSVALYHRGISNHKLLAWHQGSFIIWNTFICMSDWVILDNQYLLLVCYLHLSVTIDRYYVQTIVNVGG
jgi:hypothetical protein